MRHGLVTGGGILMMAMAGGAAAQAVTADDYARAERLLPQNAQLRVDHLLSKASWSGDALLYVESADGGARLMRYVPGGKPEPALDAGKLAEALSAATGKARSADKVAAQLGAFSEQDGQRWAFTVGGKQWQCDFSGAGHCVAAPTREPGVRSPDGRHEAFVRDWNLWLRDADGSHEVQLTTNGVEDYGYATDNAGWKHTDNAILVWSPDSKKIATFRQDQRKTGEMTLVSTNVGHPKVETWKYPLVGDEHVTMIERVVVDVPTRKLLKLDLPPEQHRSTLCDDVSCGPDGGWDDVQWAPDGKTLAFASSSRDHKQVWLRVANAATGKVRTVFDEQVKTWFESGLSAVNWRYLPGSGEVLWFSQRANWGNLYLYDLKSGQLKRAVTQGEWNVDAVLRVDEASRTVWFTGMGREGGDPYFHYFYKASLDGGEPVLLTRERADHKITLSPDGTHFLDVLSTVDTAPVALVRDSADGRVAGELATADLTRLQAAGWVPPERITVKGRDGSTDLYGLLFKPAHFDPQKKYPVVVYVYPGPQVGSVRSRSFLPGHGDNQSLAELGFIVVAVDGMGTPGRSKAFHDYYYGNIGDNTLPDQVAAVRNLAAVRPYMDLDRVGIWGHSGGGNATAAAMFKYPDFFKVGWAESGNHDNRNYEDDWAEKWQGLLTKNDDGTTNYDEQANQRHAANLKGHLMLVHGLMDDNVPPYETFLVVDALVKANKDFDLLVLPHAHHGYGNGADGQYVTRRRWDYFVRNLMGAQPPQGFAFGKPAD